MGDKSQTRRERRMEYPEQVIQVRDDVLAYAVDQWSHKLDQEIRAAEHKIVRVPERRDSQHIGGAVIDQTVHEQARQTSLGVAQTIRKADARENLKQFFEEQERGAV